MSRIITCSACGLEKPHQAHGLCAKCYLNQYRAERPEQFKGYAVKQRAEHAEELRAYGAKWRAEHPERPRYYGARNRAKHAEHHKARHEKYRAEHAEQGKAYQALYHAGHSEQDRIKVQRRRTRKRALETTLTAEQWKAIKAAYKNCCAYCGKSGLKLTQDHVLPLSKGGPYTAQNIVPACGSCNRSKYTGPPPKPVQTLLL
jgi:NMD protein affecting ribosome stability and mRNA decay